MISTTFENMNDVHAELVTIIMPYPIRAEECIEINGITWTARAVYWIVETDPSTYTRTVSLHVKVN